MKLLERSTQRILAALYSELVTPLSYVEGSKKGSRAGIPVVIVPHGVLHQGPFHALYIDVVIRLNSRDEIERVSKSACGRT